MFLSALTSCRIRCPDTFCWQIWTFPDPFQLCSCANSVSSKSSDNYLEFGSLEKSVDDLAASLCNKNTPSPSTGNKNLNEPNDSDKTLPTSGSFSLINFPKLIEDDTGGRERDIEFGGESEFEIGDCLPPSTSAAPSIPKSQGNSLSDLGTRHVNYLVAAGEKVEILSSQAAVTVDGLISAPPKPNVRAANKLSKTLSDIYHSPDNNLFNLAHIYIS